MSTFLQSILPGPTEPDVSYNFIVFIGIRPFGDFRSVTGAGLSITPQTVVEGGRNHSPHFLPYGRDQVMKWGEVTLRWGTPTWSTLYDWADAVRVGKFFRRDVFVIQLKRNGWPTRLMRFAGAFPISWKASNLDTASSEWSLSELTLVYEDFNMILTRVSSLSDLLNKVQSLGEGIADAFEDFGEEVWDDLKDGKSPLQSMGEMIYDGIEDVGEWAEEEWEDQLAVDEGFMADEEDIGSELEDAETGEELRAEAEWELPFVEADDGAAAEPEADDAPPEEEASPFSEAEEAEEDDTEAADDPPEEEASPFTDEDGGGEDAPEAEDAPPEEEASPFSDEDDATASTDEEA
jgi:phage tail-like protein